jgi:carboxymethylenebutenolidase
MIVYGYDHTSGRAYLALPESGSGPGVLVLHAWWGLNDFFKGFCDRLSKAGFVALAPDLYNGEIATTVPEAEALLKEKGVFSNSEAYNKSVMGALHHLRAHPALRGKLGVIGFSMGGFWALWLSGEAPEDVRAVVDFYSYGEGDFAKARADYLGHFATKDDYEPIDGIRKLEDSLRSAGRNVTFHYYDNVGHWFFEDNRPDAYNEEAAKLAWDRTLAFLKEKLA